MLINLMYIVLTALLALNVSAEIVNAFYSLDRSLRESAHIVQRSNNELRNAIYQQADAYPQFAGFRDKVDSTRQLTTQLERYLAQLQDTLVAMAGGVKENGHARRDTDKDISTRLLVDQGEGRQLREGIEETRSRLLALIDRPEDRPAIDSIFPLKLSPAPADAPSWEAFTFRQMPVAAVLPMLSKYQNDVQMAESMLLNYYFERTSVGYVKPDAFVPVIAADQSYVIRGEPYRGEIFLAAYSSTAGNLQVQVDGRSLPVVNGKAEFTTTGDRIGAHEHNMVISMTDPVTGEVKRFPKTFRYEVGERSVSVSAEKMNVIYIGVDNPIAISAAGVPSGQLQVQAEGLTLQPLGSSRYQARATTPGKAQIKVSGGGLPLTTFEYRVRRIPTPAILLGNKNSGSISAAELRAYNELTPVLENFDFEASCEILGYQVALARKSDDPIIKVNPGKRFSAEVKRAFESAKAGDRLFFDEINARCPGDSQSRSISGLVFQIK